MKFIIGLHIDIEDFREFGFLQEVNRRFFHPMGLALEVTKTDKYECLYGIRDFREDPEGIVFKEDYINNDDSREKANRVSEFEKKKRKSRKLNLGFEVQPIPEKKIN